jgi:hypothetical protein
MSSGIPFGLIQLKVVGDRESVTVNAANTLIDAIGTANGAPSAPSLAVEAKREYIG